jgi:hypothetical protein
MQDRYNRPMRITPDATYLTAHQRWLLEHGRRLLESPALAAEQAPNAAQRTMLQQQAQWRKRSRTRLPNAERWLWTDRSLSQASDWLTASFKSSLFPLGALVVDACCGAGVDAVALAGRGPAIGIDSDPWMAALAADNARANGQTIQVFHEPFTQSSLRGARWLHIDPDRRPGERRTLDADQFSPSLSEIFELLEALEGAAIKIAPSSRLSASALDYVNSNLSRIWIGNRGECRQQVLLHGGCRLPISQLNPAAILLEHHPEIAGNCSVFSFIGSRDSAEIQPPITQQVGEFVFDLHNVLFASGLHADWASQNGLAALENPLGYFTGPTVFCSPWAQAFRVMDEFPWDDRKVRKWLRHHQVGSVEIKCRLYGLDADTFQRRYKNSLPGDATLLVTRLNDRVRCIACRRVPISP